MSAMCPMCGYNLQADAVVETGEWRIDPRGDVLFRDRSIALRQSWVMLLLTLAAQPGRWISTEVLLARISESENRNVLSVHFSRIRAALLDAGAPVPFEGRRGLPGGYRWIEGVAA